MASDAACTESMVARSQSDTESVASPTTVLERTSLEWKPNSEVWRTGVRGLKRNWCASTCEETFLRRQQRRLLLGIFAAKHGEEPDAVDFDPEVEVAGVPAPEGFFVLYFLLNF